MNLQVHLVIERDNRVVRSCWRDLAGDRSATVIVHHEHLPAIVGHLQLVQVECREVVHEDAFYLATENVDFGSENIQGVAITT